MLRRIVAYGTGAGCLLLVSVFGLAQTRNILPSPASAQIISKLDAEASLGFEAVIEDRPFSLERKLPAPITVYGGRRRVSVGTTQTTWNATKDDLSKPLESGQVGRKVSEGLFYRKNFSLRNDSPYALGVSLTRPSFQGFPVYVELGPKQEYVADLAIGAYYVSVESETSKLHFRVNVASALSAEPFDAYVYNIIADSTNGYTQVPSFQLTGDSRR